MKKNDDGDEDSCQLVVTMKVRMTLRVRVRCPLCTSKREKHIICPLHITVREQPPRETAYGGHLFTVEFDCRRKTCGGYPFYPPIVKIPHATFHPCAWRYEVEEKGCQGWWEFSSSIIGIQKPIGIQEPGQWSPAKTIVDVLTKIYEILANENLEYLKNLGVSWKANKEATDLFEKNNIVEWRRKVHETLDTNGVALQGWLARYVVMFCLRSATKKSESSTLVSSNETDSASKHKIPGPGEAADDRSEHEDLDSGKTAECASKHESSDSGEVADGASKHESSGSGEAADAPSPRSSLATSVTRVYRTRNSSGVRYLLCCIARYI